LAVDYKRARPATCVDPVPVELVGEDLLWVASAGAYSVVDRLQHARLAAAVGTDEDGESLQVDARVAQALVIPNADLANHWRALPAVILPANGQLTARWAGVSCHEKERGQSLPGSASCVPRRTRSAMERMVCGAAR